VLVGLRVGEALGEDVGITVGLGVVGDGVDIVGESDGNPVGPWVGTQLSNGAKRRVISTYKLGYKGDVKSLQTCVPYGGTWSF